MGRAWTARFALIWLGLWAAQLAPVQLAGVFTVLGAASVGRIRSVR